MGIDSERFVYAVPQDSYCIVCNLVLKDPIEVIKCGHFVCSACWDAWLGNDNKICESDEKVVTCPYCGIDIDTCEVRKSKITWNLIQNMNVYCTQKSDGCESIYKLGFDDLHNKSCLYQQNEMDTSKLEKCDTCNLTYTENMRSHSCVKELLQNIKKQSTEISNLEHENNRLTFKLTTFEKEFMEERAELEGQFFQESLKYGKEIRDLRTRLACLQGELCKRKGQSDVENLTIELERVNGSLGFNIIGGATKDDRLSSGIYVSRIVDGGAAHGPEKLQLHDCILEVDGVNLRNATHEAAVKTFRSSGNPFKMVIQRIINKIHSCDAETQTFGVAFAVTAEKDQIDEKPVRSFQNNKSRWLTPHEIVDSANLSGSDECVNIIQQNGEKVGKTNGCDEYDSAYDTLLTQKSSRSTRSPSVNENSDSSCTTLKTISPDCSETHSVVMRNKITSTDNDNRRHSTFYVIPSEEPKTMDNKSWQDVQNGDGEAEYEYEYEEVCLRKQEGKLGMVLCYGGDEKDVAVYIGDLEDNSVADISGKVMVGDQIVQINGTHVMNVEQAYSMLQESDEITLVVARAVYENHTDYYDEAEETDLDMLDCINEEAESVFSKESSPIYASSNSSKSSSPKVNRKTGDDISPTTPLSAKATETGRSRAMTLSPVNSSSNEDFPLSERRNRSISVNDNSSTDEKLEHKRNSSAENTKNEKESNIKSSLKNFVKTRLGSSEKKVRSSSHSDDSCELNKIPRCDSNSSNNSNRSKHSSEKENALKSPQEQLKTKLKEQRNQSKMKAYLDSPSLQRHRVNNNNMFLNQNNGFSLVNSPVNYSGKMMNFPVFTPVNMQPKNMIQFHPGMVQGMPTFIPNHSGLVSFSMTGNQHPLRAQNGMNASVSSLRSAMKNSTMNNNNINTCGKTRPKKVQIDPHPGWNETERRVWEEFKIIQSMESKENGTKNMLNVDPAKVEAEWRVRRSKDGKHVYIKKTNSARTRILKERAQQINDERCGVTTDDDTFTVYHGQYWNRDQRKKQLNRHNDRRKKLLEKAALKAAFENKTEKAMAEMVQRKMTLPGVVFDNFVTVEEILSQRNRSGVFEGPVHVTTI